MRIKRFNENIDRKLIDPYNEENWSDKKKENFPNRIGVCVECGSDELEWGNVVLDEETMKYEYECENCGCEGEEVYNITFVLNRFHVK